MLRGYRYRIYPNREQCSLIEQHFGAVRFVYNRSLFLKNTMYSKFKINISEMDLNRNLTLIKEHYPWMKDLNSQSLQQVNRNLLNGFKNFFEGTGNYPVKKSRKDNKFSFQVPQNYQINLTSSQIYLPKIGWVNIVLHRDFLDDEFIQNELVTKEVNGEMILDQKLNKEFSILKTVTVSRTSAGRYHVSILIDDRVPEPNPVKFDQNSTIGVDVGINRFATISNGEEIENPRYLQNSLKKLKKLQKRVSSKQKGSRNRRKAIQKLAKQHQLIANQRHDFQHKVTTRLISENQAVATETLNIKGMMKNHCRAQATSDVAWYSFFQKLEYKARWYGKTVLKIGQWEPSSKTCSVCDYYYKDLKDDERTWTCSGCGTIHDRDHNASHNIKRFALRNYDNDTVGTTGRACGHADVGQVEILLGTTRKTEAGSCSVFS
ncbi:RNA-guided endonuclease TnpB family protein [uncultured Methanolobus sp.]|uniref:RNA-guided endonuclease TnpB family protein n=1 Tax=uncultured Methanolobus sp. TaxID=218300 RepID=UPI0029C8F4A3|nr:RNA-guided endonuclease TnpB family protein [uncultured Methanolobus sp.]